MKTKVVSILTMVYGGCAAGFGLFFMIIVFMQKWMISGMPSSANPEFQARLMEQRLYMETLHAIWLIFIPFLVVLGLLFAFSGYQLYKDREIGKRIAYGSSLSTVLWFALYAVISTTLGGPLARKMFGLNDFLFVLFGIFSYLVSFIMICGYPVFLLFYLPRTFRHLEPSLRQGASGP